MQKYTEEIPVNKYQKKSNHVKVGRNNVHYIKVLKLCIFRFNVNSEFRLDEQSMKKKTCKDLTFDFFQTMLFPKFRVRLICGCLLYRKIHCYSLRIHIVFRACV